MKIEEYLKKYNMNVPCFAKIIRTSALSVRGWIRKERIPSYRIAYRIHKKTRGEITLPELGWINKKKRAYRENRFPLVVYKKNNDILGVGFEEFKNNL